RGGASEATGAPDPRADPGRPATGPCPAALIRPEPSNPVGAAWAGRCAHLDTPGWGDMAAEPRLVTAVRSTGGVDPAAAYREPKLGAFAMAAGGLGVYGPVSVERRRNCGRSRAHDCGSGCQSDAAATVADHGGPLVWSRRIDLPVKYELINKPQECSAV